MRQVTCHRKVTGKKIPDRWCEQKRRNLTRPESEQICNKGPCYQWIPTETWTEVMNRMFDTDCMDYGSPVLQCSARCNGGHEENLPRCAIKNEFVERIVDDQLCQNITRPQIRRPCNSQPCPTRPMTLNRIRRRRRWDVGPWSSVSVLYRFNG